MKTTELHALQEAVKLVHQAYPGRLTADGRGNFYSSLSDEEPLPAAALLTLIEEYKAQVEVLCDLVEGIEGRKLPEKK